jgi:hypothetical protein
MNAKLFLLRDLMNETPRWVVGELRSSPDGERVHLTIGRPCPLQRVHAQIIHAGPPLSYSHNCFGAPIVTSQIADVFTRFNADDAQIIACCLDGFPDYWAVNVLRSVKCVDEDRAVFAKWTIDSHRPDLCGQYHYINRLVIDSSKVPEDAHFFRIWGWEVALIVSETMKQAMEAAGCHGAVFVPVELS